MGYAEAIRTSDPAGELTSGFNSGYNSLLTRLVKNAPVRYQDINILIDETVSMFDHAHNILDYAYLKFGNASSYEDSYTYKYTGSANG